MSDSAVEGDLPPEIHQAAGVLSARLGISGPEARGVLRTIAHCAGTPLIDVARHILVRRDTVTGTTD